MADLVDDLLGERWKYNAGWYDRVDGVRIERVRAEWGPAAKHAERVNRLLIRAWEATVKVKLWEPPFTVWVLRSGNTPDTHMYVGREVGLRRTHPSMGLHNGYKVPGDFDSASIHDIVRIVQQWCDKVIP